MNSPFAWCNGISMTPLTTYLPDPIAIFSSDADTFLSGIGYILTDPLIVYLTFVCPLTTDIPLPRNSV
jgi:hypothetical protein